jgi:hypothetical protein
VSLAQVFELAEQSLSAFDSAQLRTASDDELCRLAIAAEALARRVAAAQVAAAAEIADRSRPELGVGGLARHNGCTKPAMFLGRILLISGADASRRIHLGLALRGETALGGEVLEPRYGAVAKAVDSGALGAEVATVIVRSLDAARRVAEPADLIVAEQALVENARINTPHFVADLARRVRDRLDPDGVLPREQETLLRREIVLGRERNGIVPIHGGLAPTEAALLKSVFDESNAPGAHPRFLSPQDEVEGTVTTVAADGTTSVSLRDVRNRGQRQHDVLVGLLKAGIRNTGLEAGQIRSTAEVVAHVALADLESGVGVGWIDGIDEPVSISTIERLACDAVFRKLVLGNDGEPLALGRARYPFTSAQKRTMIARDGDRCILDCDSPATWGDGHHVIEYWTNGAKGQTDVDNGVMLCPRHHDFIHHSDWQLAMINGLPYVLAPPYLNPAQTWRRLGKPRVRVTTVA